MDNKNIYENGQYLEKTGSWHSEDSPWKARQIISILEKNAIQASSIGEVGCGAGGVLSQLSGFEQLQSVKFSGYDISPQAISLAGKYSSDRVGFHCNNMLNEDNTDYFDILLAIDVLEHVPDYMDFLESCRKKAKYKIYHIPLDIHVSSVLRNSFARGRYSIGHLHYFVADTALDTLRDTGHEIVDYIYTDAAFGLFRQHPSFRKAMANIPRWVISRFSVSLAARLLGGYSLLVLTR